MEVTAQFAGYRLAAVTVADTGREPPEVPEPVEIGVTVLDGAAVGETRAWLVRPNRAITPWATRGHGIGNLEVEQAPPVAAVAEEIRYMLGDRIVVAVRALHFHAMLSAVLLGWSPPRVVDLRRLSVLVWPGTSQALGALEDRARLKAPGPAGRAKHDAMATAALFVAIAARKAWPPERLLAPGTVLCGDGAAR